MFCHNNDNNKIFRKEIVQKIGLNCDDYCRKNLWHSFCDLFSIHKQNVFLRNCNKFDGWNKRPEIQQMFSGITSHITYDLLNMWGWKYDTDQHQNQDEKQNAVLFSSGSILYICALNGSDKFPSFRPIQSTWSNFGNGNKVRSEGNSICKVCVACIFLIIFLFTKKSLSTIVFLRRAKKYFTNWSIKHKEVKKIKLECWGNDCSRSDLSHQLQHHDNNNGRWR